MKSRLHMHVSLSGICWKSVWIEESLNKKGFDLRQMPFWKNTFWTRVLELMVASWKTLNRQCSSTHSVLVWSKKHVLRDGTISISTHSTWKQALSQPSNEGRGEDRWIFDLHQMSLWRVQYDRRRSAHLYRRSWTVRWKDRVCKLLHQNTLCWIEESRWCSNSGLLYI